MGTEPLMRIGLVGCVKSKRESPSPAKDLYTSPMFTGGRRAVESGCDRWFILSAEHGLLDPDTVIAPYDRTLTTEPRRRRRAWSRDVLGALKSRLSSLGGHTFEIHAGEAYYGHGLKEGLEEVGAEVVVPTEGMPMGRKLSYYAGGFDSGRNDASRARELGAGRPPAHGSASAGSGEAPPRGKYRPLYEHLRARADEPWDATFADIEHIIGDQLPRSAKAHPAWWANDTSESHSHGRAWLAAGWQTSRVQVEAGRVRFQMRRS